MPFFLIYLFIEVLVSVQFATYLGGILTFLEIVASAIIGFFLLTNFRYTLGENVKSLISKEITIEEFQKLSLFSALGAILLIVPGFFSDIIGILLQFGSFGTIFARRVLNLKNKTDHKKKDIDAIDVEIIDNNSDTK